MILKFIEINFGILGMLFILRHGETEWNTLLKRQGQKNSPLTDKGKEQAKKMAKAIRNIKKDLKNYKMLVSPLGRTIETSNIIIDELGFDRENVIIEDLLKEISFGDFEGIPKPEIKKLYPEEEKKQSEDPWTYVYPNGESFSLVNERIKKLFEKYNLNDNYIIVTHNGISRLIRGMLEGKNTKEIFELPYKNHEQNTVYAWDGKSMNKVNAV